MSRKKLEYTLVLHPDGKINTQKRVKQEIREVFGTSEIKHLKMTIQEPYNKRSNQQNRYWWGVVIEWVLRGFIAVGHSELSLSNPEDKKTIHRFLVNKFLDNGKDLVDAEGNVYKSEPTTTTLSKKEFAEFTELVRQWAAEYLQINIPDPESEEEEILIQ